MEPASAAPADGPRQALAGSCDLSPSPPVGTFPPPRERSPPDLARPGGKESFTVFLLRRQRLCLIRERDGRKLAAVIGLLAQAGAAIGEEAVGLGRRVAAGARHPREAEPRKPLRDVARQVEQEMPGARGGDKKRDGLGGLRQEPRRGIPGGLRR